ncbi:hypothetical protein SAMN05443287_12320 [Micromonospora phaseoli]|uniref:Uncharacterized protein n=1 Tax=Micromonospora phaseoli TaxID=1144548 RepID=A0A1H7E5W4_9ACTN|nr:hypothetical protein [Micromonospora phaseoli]PZV88427.1 hypothetical protein CLV64_1207 [Micromonospora phaseoli]GIJ81285.1 hypothetical protein Xph01_57170 [Micromonospora phaseoli]SEK07020.1 hypothetical protein SAMN05443287_12320 [Micromonospora phaseoli]
MQAWTDGDLETEFEQRLDELLAELCPDWRHPELPEPYRNNDRFVAYNRRNAKRLHLGDLLAARPEVAAAVADRLLAVIVCDEDVSSNKQLIHPLLVALGRRHVQRYLISVIETGPEHKKVCAVRAWYWSQVSLVYESVEALRARRPTPTSRAADDEVADLRGLYRIACLAAFLTCRHVATREWLARGFILKDEYYPANLHDLVAQARIIAERDAHRYKDLLAKDDDGTNMAQLRFDGH